MFAIRRATASLCATFLLFQGGVSVSTARECYAGSPGEVVAPEDGPCAGLPTESCATFAAGVYDELDTWLGVVPVSSDPPPRSINFNEIILDDCTDTKIAFEIKIHGWDPDLDGMPGLKAWEVDLDSSGCAFDIVGHMSPEMVACSTMDDCVAAWGGLCTLIPIPCDDDRDCWGPVQWCGGAACNYPIGVGGYCSPGFQYTSRADGVLLKELPFVDVTTPDFRYGSTLSPTGIMVRDSGIIYYGGTLKLVTSSDVAGTASVITAPTSFMKDQDNNFIPLTGLVHAYVVCQFGQCCDWAEPRSSCLSDTVTEEQCAALVAGAYYWDPTKTCADPCCECLDHGACADGDACTVDRCVDCACESTPVTIGPDDCCAWQPANESADVNGLGVIASNNDGNPCTEDVCDDPSACAVGLQCGVPENPSLPPGTHCILGGDPCSIGQCFSQARCVFRMNVCGACCSPNGSCTGGVTETACTTTGGQFMGIGKVCLGDSDGDGKDDRCVRPSGAIPTVSHWGLAAMLLLLVIGARICFRRTVGEATA